MVIKPDGDIGIETCNHVVEQFSVGDDALRA
jgi:hypothetical protein